MLTKENNIISMHLKRVKQRFLISLCLAKHQSEIGEAFLFSQDAAIFVDNE
jgi:hypothetical protein